MTSCHGDALRITGHLWGDSTDPQRLISTDIFLCDIETADKGNWDKSSFGRNTMQRTLIQTWNYKLIYVKLFEFFSQTDKWLHSAETCVYKWTDQTNSLITDNILHDDNENMCIYIKVYEIYNIKPLYHPKYEFCFWPLIAYSLWQSVISRYLITLSTWREISLSLAYDRRNIINVACFNKTAGHGNHFSTQV